MTHSVQKFISDSCKIYKCKECDCHLAKESDLVSKLFQGQTGPAYLFDNVYNKIIDEVVYEKYMTTGKHRIRQLRCSRCAYCIGWMYVEVFVEDQKYKEGKSIIEKSFMTAADNSEVKRPPYLPADETKITIMNYFHWKK